MLAVGVCLAQRLASVAPLPLLPLEPGVAPKQKMGQKSRAVATCLPTSIGAIPLIMKPGLFAAAIVATLALGFALGRISVPASSPSPASASSSSPAALSAPSPSMTQTGSSIPQGAIRGTVAEVIQVPNYTYVRLQTDQGEQWAAVTSTQSIQQGQSVTVAQATRMTDFASKSLNRTFPEIWFGSVMTEGAPSAQQMGGGGLPQGHPPPSAAASAVAAVEKAEGPLGLRVADIFSEKEALGGKQVRVRGVATKVTEVKGMQYVHLKDGSGTAGKNDDLTVLTASAVKVDQVVTVEGQVALNKDLGMGAPYPVVIENATVVGN